MADPSALPSTTARRGGEGGVVRSLARAAERPCARPGCPAPARSTLTLSYATAEVFLDRLTDVADPQRYDLCARHAARTEPPRGWSLTDRRPDDDRDELDPPPAPVRELGGEATVAVLAAALRAVPDSPAAATPAADAGAVAGPVTQTRSDAVPTAAPARSVDEPVAAPAPASDPRDEPTVELPRLRTPRRVPAAGPREPATDW